jgi:hypothetical protein
MECCGARWWGGEGGGLVNSGFLHIFAPEMRLADLFLKSSIF